MLSTARPQSVARRTRPGASHGLPARTQTDRIAAAVQPRAHRVLAIVDDVRATGGLPRELRGLRASAGGALEVLVVAPALNSRLRFWCNDDQDARLAAARRVDEVIVRLLAEGLPATGQVGDPQPLQAIDDALAGFDADRLIIATGHGAHLHWLERGLVDRAEARFGRPVLHLLWPAPQPYPASPRAETHADLARVRATRT